MGSVMLAAALSLAIGAVLGMLGGGGAILTLPMLVYVLDVEPRAAIAMSLVVVGITGAASSIPHARAGNVQWKVGLLFGAAAMAGAFGGGRLARFVPAQLLLLFFAAIMLATAVAMLRRRDANDAERAPSVHLGMGRTLVLGVFVGAISGLVGAGGGFMIVPALVLAGGLSMRHAIGTSLFVIALQSFAGFLGHAAHVTLDLELLAVVSGAAVIGSLAGAAIGKKVRTEHLRQGFAWLILAMGVFIVGKQTTITITAIVAVLTLAIAYVALRARRSLQENRSCTTSHPSLR